MITGAVWLTKLVVAHLLTDFVFQPYSWVEDRNEKHFASAELYLHGLVTAIVAWIFIGWVYWPVVCIILVTHILIDGWKSYRPKKICYFLIDQVLHLAVIGICWGISWQDMTGVRNLIHRWNGDLQHWAILGAFVFVTSPAGILIGQLTSQWSKKIDDANQSLAHAGKWIGIAERIIVLILVLQNQYSAIGLLVTAKGIIRFNEKDRQEVKTEYLVIGTLLSIGIAIVAGLAVKGVG